MLVRMIAFMTTRRVGGIRMSDDTTTDQKNAAHDMAPGPAVVKSIEIAASTDDVWHALTDPDKIAQWMGGARVESRWEPGGDIAFTGEMPNFNKTFRDRGTVL